MRQIAMKCTQCGAALPPRSRWSVIDCSYCGARMVLDGSSLVRREEYRDGLARAEEVRSSKANCRIGDAAYHLDAGSARGESSDVYAGWRCPPLAEAVVVKALRSEGDAGRLEREFETLSALQKSSARGSEYYSRLIPAPVARATIRGGAAGGRQALVVRRLNGFVDTLADAAPETKRDPRHSVWIWKRLLETLDWTHRSGFVHAAVTPRHALIHARDHGVALVGWASAAAPGAPLAEAWSADEAFYPASVLSGAPLDARTDLVMAARCAAFSLTGKPDDAGSDLPKPLKDVLTPWMAGDGKASADAWALHEAVDAAAREAFGPPKYVELKTPAWRDHG